MTEIGIKFRCNWIKSEAIDDASTKELNYWRNKMYELKLIGEDAAGIGYGNISERFLGKEFIISGATTGKLKNLTNEHYTKVIEFSIEQNSLTTIGPIIASSESLTHATIYELDSQINAVIHVHNQMLWKKNLHKIPTTNESVEYGTPAMAKEIIRLYKKSNLPQKKLLVMAGHKNGLVSFGENLEEAANLIINELNLNEARNDD